MNPEDFKSKNLLAALEFKFIIDHGPQYEHEIKYDYFKLMKAKEVEHKYMLVFTNTIEKEKGEGKNYFKIFRKEEGIKIIYVAVYGDVDNKKKRIRQYPDKWLKI